MTKRPTITIHFGASHDDVSVDGTTITRHRLDRSEQAKMRGIIVGALAKDGYFTEAR